MNAHISMTHKKFSKRQLHDMTKYGNIVTRVSISIT